MAKELSGPQWVLRFPTSKKVEDLDSSFKGGVKKFLAALDNAGASVRIAATFRPPERVYLMCSSYEVAHGLDPAKVPARSGVEIEWVHPTPEESVHAAKAMVAGYEIVHQPSPHTLHALGKAIDMHITWTKPLAITDGKGAKHTISSSPKNDQNKELWEIGKTFGVVKLPSDPPHWSATGH